MLGTMLHDAKVFLGPVMVFITAEWHFSTSLQEMLTFYIILVQKIKN